MGDSPVAVSVILYNLWVYSKAPELLLNLFSKTEGFSTVSKVKTEFIQRYSIIKQYSPLLFFFSVLELTNRMKNIFYASFVVADHLTVSSTTGPFAPVDSRKMSTQTPFGGS